MLNYLLLISCVVAAVHSRHQVGFEECREEDITYSFKTKGRGTSAFLEPNNKVHMIEKNSLGTSACIADDLIPSTSGECVQRLINYCAYEDINKKPDLPVVGVVDTKLVEQIQLTPYQVIKTSSIYVENESDIQQEGHSTQYEETVTSSFEFSMTQSIGITASASFGIPLIGESHLEISTEFNFGETWSSSESKTITFPSQTVQIPPKSRIRLTFDVLLGKFDTKYASSFVLDPDHDLIKKCIDKISGPTPSFSLNLDKDGMENAATATFTSTQQTLNSLPISYVSEKHEIRVHISEAEPIATVIDDKSIPVINVLNLPSTNIFNAN